MAWIVPSTLNRATVLPSTSTVVDLPEVELFYSNGRYEATHPGFNQPGTYKII